MSEQISTVLIASFFLTIAPGPDVMYVIAQSISKGKKYGLASAIGLSVGLLFHTALLAFGISQLISQNESIFLAIKYLGALYLLWLAYKVWKSSPQTDMVPMEKSPKKYPITNTFQGLIMNISNPKVLMFFLAIIPNFIDLSNENIKGQIFVMGIIFVVQALIIFSLYAILASKLTGFLRENTKFQRFLKYFQIIVFVGLAVMFFV